MKRIIIILLLALALAAPALADWRFYGSSTNPLLQAYYTTIYGTNFLPLVANTGSVGTAANAFNSMYADSGVFGATSLYPATASNDMVLSSGSTYNINSSAGAITWTAKANSAFSITGGGVNFSVAGVSSALSSTAGLSLNNIITAYPSDNPYIAFRDSSAGAAPTRDSLIYNGASFTFTKPVVTAIYASGVRPTTAELGQIIIIDGTTTTDSMLVYLGGAWVRLYP